MVCFARLLGSLLSAANLAAAAKNFAGSNLYYAAGLTDAQSTTLLSALQDANVKVLRVWLDGQDCSDGCPKDTLIDPFPALESDSPGSWNDTVLDRLDDFMIKAHEYGIKLCISIHSYNALTGNSDFYGQWYGRRDFYTNADAIQYYRNRIAHVMAHVNPHNGKPWGECSDYIFAFETQNEAATNSDDDTFMRAHLPAWQCTMATEMQSHTTNRSILTTTGGGNYVDNSVLDGYLDCDALDIIAIHAYGPDDMTTDKLSPRVAQAQAAGKMLLMQEWGACYTSSANNACMAGDDVLDDETRAANMERWGNAMASAGLPHWYWQVIPNDDPHWDWDYEVGTTEAIWDSLKSTMLGAADHEAAFDFWPWLLDGRGNGLSG